MALTAPPTAPTTSDPTTFATRSDALVAWLATHVTEEIAFQAALTSIAAGTAFAIPYTFSTTTTDADPTAGYLRLDNTTQNIATTIRANLSSADTTSWSSVLATFADSTSVVKGQIRLVKLADATKWIVFNVTGLASPTSYKNIAVTVVGASSTSPFANGDALALLFTRNGDIGTNAITGGATQTGSFTLPSGAAYAQQVTPTGYGQACTAAVATGFTKGLICQLTNASDYDYAFKDSTGVIRAFIPPQSTCAIALVDNSTAAGVWSFTNSKLVGTTASTYSTSSTGSSNGGIKFVSLDSDRSLLLYGYTSVYARVHRKSTNTWSSAVLVRAAILNNAYLGILSATNQVLVVSNDTTTGQQAVTLTVNASTDAITVNAATSIVLVGNFYAFGQLVAVGSSWVLSYARTGIVTCISAITISGTTPTIGAETITPGTTVAVPQLYVSGALVMTFGASATFFYATPYTVSGSTLTLGTGATSAVTGSGYRSMAVGTRWHVYAVNTTLKGLVVTLTSTTATISVATLSATAAQSPVSLSDAVLVSSSKSCIASTNNSTAVYVNHLIDTAGTASAGTEIVLDTNTVTVSPAWVSSVSNIGKLAVQSSSANSMFTIDSSGTSPVLADVCESGGGTVSSSFRVLPASSALSIRSPRKLVSTAGVLALSQAQEINDFGGYLYGSRLSLLPTNVIAGGNSNGDVGLTNGESWFYSPGQTGGLNNIIKVEVAQP